MNNTIQLIVIAIIPVLFAIILHEVSHGYVAYKLGDNTAKNAGRLTLNPIKHIDPFGTILLPLLLILVGSPFLFGYAKPVPVNFNALGNPKRDTGLVAPARQHNSLRLQAQISQNYIINYVIERNV